MNTNINIKTQFEGIHCWPDAPEQVAFLRNEHRHVFKVEVLLQVGHDDRDVEFFMAKTEIDRYLRMRFNAYHENAPELKQLQSMSCEMLAKDIAGYCHECKWHVLAVTVQEDDENSATFWA